MRQQKRIILINSVNKWRLGLTCIYCTSNKDYDKILAMNLPVNDNVVNWKSGKQALYFGMLIITWNVLENTTYGAK